MAELVGEDRLYRILCAEPGYPRGVERHLARREVDERDRVGLGVERRPVHPDREPPDFEGALPGLAERFGLDRHHAPDSTTQRRCERRVERSANPEGAM